MSSFHEYLRNRLTAGGFTTEDALGAFLPLVREVLAAHAAGQVAPLEGLDALQVEGGRIWFAQGERQPVRSNAGDAAAGRGGRRGRRRDRGRGPPHDRTGRGRRRTGRPGRRPARRAEITRPVYLPGYVAWEHRLGHHDPLTDVFSLGMILASLACGLDLGRAGRRCSGSSAGRRNLFALNPGLHPVLAQAIFRTTELDRHRRVQDLRALLHSLENYRDQDVDLRVRPGPRAGLRAAGPPQQAAGGAEQAAGAAVRGLAAEPPAALPPDAADGQSDARLGAAVVRHPEHPPGPDPGVERRAAGGGVQRRTDAAEQAT